MNNKNLLQTVKFAIIFAAIVISYLFALNGRYSYCDDFVFFDKWTKGTVILFNETGQLQEPTIIQEDPDTIG